MKKVVAYNFTDIITEQNDWENLYRSKRRDANFAAVFEVTAGSYIALRDHLGTVPLYYRIKDTEVMWSCNYSELVCADDHVPTANIQTYLGIPSSKVSVLIPDIKIVPPGSVIKVTDGIVSVLYTYQIKIESLTLPSRDLYQQFKTLMDQAVERTIKTDTVGLYLSGGMDSGLLGMILKEKGIGIRSYTALPWGVSGTEYTYAKINNEKIESLEHHMVDVDPQKYGTYFSKLPSLYKTPHGTATAINIAALWNSTNINQEKQVFYAQNTDTLTSSVPSQVHSIMMNLIPYPLREKLVKSMKYRDVVTNYLSHATRELYTAHEFQTLIPDHLGVINKIALAGMYIIHTQSDSEAINGPSIAANQATANPYYDMDLIEFYLSIPSLYKIQFNFKQKTLLSIEKKLFRKYACEKLPYELVHRKKGFVLPKQRNNAAKNFFNSLPTDIPTVTPRDHYEKISLIILSNYFASLGVDLR